MISVFSKGKKLHSIIYNLCPRCHTGKFWSNDNVFKNIFIKSNNNLEKCDKCNLKYEIEPGFWYGAMYVSYGLTVFVAILTWLIMYILNKEMDIFIQISIISFLIIILSPVVYFLSRLIWINFFVSYNKN